MDKELMNKIQKTVENVSFLRGLIITKFIDIESYIEVIIKNYFVISNKQISFREMALSDPYFSFGLKRRIFDKILVKINFETYKEFKKDLYKAERLRNRIAHSGMFGFDGHLIYHDKKQEEIKKVEDMYNEFMALWVKIFAELRKIFDFLIAEAKKGEIKLRGK